MERITSRRNPVVAEMRRAAAGSPERMLLDGPHLIREALASGVTIELLAVADEDGGGELAALADAAEGAGARTLRVTTPVLSAISPVREPSGIVALARRPSPTLDAALGGSPPLVLVVADVQDPGNVGAVIRAGEACGVTGVVTTPGTADPFGWKAVRGSMGSVFRVPVASRQAHAALPPALRARGIAILAAVPRGGTLLPRCALARPIAVFLGGEGGGLPAETLDDADETITIPMRPPVESLNVATAAALIVYEAMRQRGGFA